jgi:mannose/fructose-specific phosphotransferase system component IIA
MVAGIIVSHGRLAEELLDTARKVYGDFSDCYAVSNEGKSPHALYEEIDLLIRAQEAGRSVVFVDFAGGSCCHACMRLKVGRRDVPVITGVNLPMLLAFLNKRDAVPFERLAEEVLERGRLSVQSVDPRKT